MIDYASFLGDVNIGYYSVVNNELGLVGEDLEAKNINKIKKVLKIEKIYKLTIAQTNLIGLFCVMNVNGIVVPEIVEEEELSKLDKIANKHGLNLGIIKTKHTALGNLIVCNDKGALVSKLLKRSQINKISKVLNVKSYTSTIASLPIVGSCAIANNKGVVLHRDVKESEAKKAEKVLQVEADVASVNFGSPYVKSGILCNDYGALVGEKTTGPELARISEILQV